MPRPTDAARDRPLPVAKQNRWRDAAADLPSDWAPWRTVSVVIPNYNNGATLDLTLASLAAQDYPDDLLDVVVVDDGSDPAYELPAIRPARCRVITPDKGWGRANACATGAAATAGEIILWLDSDMIVPSDHVRSHVSWYDRLSDVVTKGDILFIPQWELKPDDVYAQVLDGRIGSTLTSAGFTRQWVERRYAETDDLNTDRHDVFSIWTGATATTSREMYERVGGMDPALRLGEDSELAYRLWNAGAVFVPARDAVGWHLGSTNTQRRSEIVNAHDKPYFAQRAPMLTGKRTRSAAVWEVPLVRAVVEATVESIADATVCVDKLLASSETDLCVDLVAPWDTMHDGRRRVLDDRDAALYTTYEWYRHEPRVRLVTERPTSAYPSAYQIDVPVRAGLRPATLAAMIRRLQTGRLGGLRVAFDDAASSIDLWRVAALERAQRSRGADESLQDAVDRVWGVWWAPPSEFPFDDLAQGAATTPAESSRAASAAKPGASREAVLAAALKKARAELLTAKRQPVGIRDSLRALRSDMRALAKGIRGRLVRHGKKGATST